MHQNLTSSFQVKSNIFT